MSSSLVAAPPVPRAPRLLPQLPALRGLLPVRSVPAAMRAVRATIVVPGLFAFTSQVIGNPQMATFAAFGGFATLIFAAFNGNRLDKLKAHLGLAVVGSLLVIIGTAVNSMTATAAVVTLLVAFVVLFGGVLGPNAASGATAAMLAYVLPAASPGTSAMIPSRLEGWWLASLFGTAAVMLFSPAPAGNPLRAAIGSCADALADELEAVVDGHGFGPQWNAALAAKERLITTFTATPFRPTGLATPDQAMANVVEVLEWCTALISDVAREGGDLALASEEDRQLMGTAAGVLRAVGSLVRGGDIMPDIDRLEQLRAESAVAMRASNSLDPGYPAAVHLAFHARTIAVAARTAAADALIGTRRADPETISELRQVWAGQTPSTTIRTSSAASNNRPPDSSKGRLPAARNAVGSGVAGVRAAGTVASRHASIRSVWFLNSVRGAVALAAAVTVADLTDVQHGFWVVLGALSVLRSNATSTGATALRALAGTTIGFAIGGALIVAIGTDTNVLWIALPVAVLVAAYTPGTAPFAFGQAAFTVVIAILFNLIAPVGWKVGVVRVEDVAIGCGVSLAVGILFWPRGAGAVVGDDLAQAFHHGALYLGQSARWALGLQAERPDERRATVTAGVRLDDGLRGFLAEQGAKRVPKEDLWRLVGAAMRLRLTANSLEGLDPPVGQIDEAGAALAEQAELLATWYDQLAGHVGRSDPPSVDPLAPPDPVAHHAAGEPAAHAYRVVCTLWVSNHLNHLQLHHDEVIGPAAKVAEQRKRRWWQ